MKEVSEGWSFISIGPEGHDTRVGGINPWEVKWALTGEHITVAHPEYPRQRHRMPTYTVTGSNPPIVFAAGEFSAGTFGFFVPRSPRRDGGA